MDREAIDSLLDYKKKQIALTLEGVRFFDSAGLGEIVRISTP
jgi:anti-anti-sigma regulatory factor